MASSSPVDTQDLTSALPAGEVAGNSVVQILGLSRTQTRAFEASAAEYVRLKQRRYPTSTLARQIGRADILIAEHQHAAERTRAPIYEESVQHAHRMLARQELLMPLTVLVGLGGMLASIKFSHTKNPRAGSTHTKYAMWDLEDLNGIVRCIMWPEQFAEFGHLVKADEILALRATLDRRPGGDEVNLIVQELIPLDELSARFTSGVVIRVREDEHGVEALATLREIVRGYPGPKPLRLRLELADGGSVMVDCAKSGVTIDAELRRRVDELLGPGNFRLVGTATRTSASSAVNNRRRVMARN